MIVQQVKIPVYEKVDDKFNIIRENVYSIRYLKNENTSLLEIVVNDKPSGCYVNVISHRTPIKSSILTAISKYIDGRLDKQGATKKGLSLETLKTMYGAKILNNIKRHLLPINKEMRRDTLTEFNLI